MLGYRTYADYVLKHRMASKVKNVYNLLYDLIDAYKPTAEKEYDARWSNWLRKWKARISICGHGIRVIKSSHKLQLKKYNLDAEMLRTLL